MTRWSGPSWVGPPYTRAVEEADGSGTSPMSETFPDLETFQEKTLARLRKILKDPGKT